MPLFQHQSQQPMLDMNLWSSSSLDSESQDARFGGGINNHDNGNGNGNGYSNSCSSNTSISRGLFDHAKSPAVSLCSKFEQLERKWSIYNKFGDLEKQWSRLSSTTSTAPAPVLPAAAAAVASSSSSSSSFFSAKENHNQTNITKQVIKMEDLQNKWTQLHAFATQEKNKYQQHQRNDPQDIPVISKEQRDESEIVDHDDHDHKDVPDSTSGRSLEHPEPSPSQPLPREDEKLGFVIKKRGAKRPRRLFALTKIRHWNFGGQIIAAEEENHSSPDKRGTTVPQDNDGKLNNNKNNDDDETDEEVLFDQPDNDKDTISNDRKGCQKTTIRTAHLTMSREDMTTADESRDEQSSFEDLTQRVLLSMPNHQLWGNSLAIDTDDDDDDDDVDNNGVQSSNDAGDRHHHYHMVLNRGYLAVRHRHCKQQQQQDETIVFSSSLSGETREDVDQLSQDDEQNGVKLISDVVPSDDDEDGDDEKEEICIGEQVSNNVTKKSPNTLSEPLAISVGGNKVVDGALQPVVRDLLHLRLITVSAVLIQSWVRMKIVRRAYLKRSAAAPHEVRRRRDLLTPTVARVQTVRKFQTVERARKSAALIQSLYRCWECRRNFLELRNKTIKIQRFSRAFLRRNREELAASRLQRFWMERNKTSSQWSFDESGISTLSFDQSYLYDDPEGPYLLPHFPNAIAWDPEDPILTTSPLPPLHPSSPLLPRARSAPRSRATARNHSSKCRPLPPCLPPLAPTLRSRGFSPGRPNARNRSQTMSDVINYIRRQQSPRKKRAPPSPRTTSEPSDTTLQCVSRHDSFRLPSKKRVLSSLSYVSPKTKNHKSSPLANVIPSSDEDERVLELRYNVKSKKDRNASPARNLSLKRKLSLKGKFKKQQTREEPTPNTCGVNQETRGLWSCQHDTLRGSWENTCDEEDIEFDLHLIATEEEIAASISIQKVWRGHRAQLTLATLLARTCTVVCECNKGKVSRDRILRHRAQAMCVAKAIGQVGCFGANERLGYKGSEIAAEWKNVIYVNFKLPDGGTINTFATVYAMSAIRRIKCIDSMSRKRVFMLVIKSALAQHLSEQQQKASRLSMLERSLTRRRAPAEREAAILIQTLVRGIMQAQRYTLIKTSAIAIQKMIRCRQTRKAYKRRKDAAREIQAFFRGELVRGIVFQYWAAAIALRTFWNDYRQERMAAADLYATKIQAAFRGGMSRVRLLERLYSASIIQAKFRSFVARSKFILLREACLVLQMKTRRNIALRMETEWQSAIFIQRWWRFEQCNSMMRGLCATIIETAYRRYRECRKYKRFKAAVLTAQKCQRGCAARKHFRALTQLRSLASIFISSWYRGIVQQRKFERQRLCATKIQNRFRLYYTQLNYQQMLWAIIILQFQTRKMIEIRQTNEEKAFKERCVTCIQSTYRRYRQQRLYNAMMTASCRIQAHWRGHHCHFEFHIHRGAAIYLQRVWRDYRTRCRMASRLQAHIRGKLVCRAFNHKRSAANSIQHWAKGILIHREFRQKRGAAILIQSFWRRLCDEACFFLQKVMIIRMQCNMRGFLYRRKFIVLRRKIIKIQASARRYYARRKFHISRQQVIGIQRQYRRFFEKKHANAILIQANVRRFQLKQKFETIHLASTKIRRWWRARAIRLAYCKLCQKTRLIQLTARMFLRRQHHGRIASATTIQSWYRSNIQVCKYVIYQFSIVLTQSAWRSHQKRNRYLEMRRAAIVLQTGYRKRLSWKKAVGSVIFLQALVRRMMAKRKRMSLLAQKRKADKVQHVRTRRKVRIKSALERQTATIILQAGYRKYRKRRTENKAATLIQHLLRRRMAARMHEEKCQAAALLQRNWRGFSCKKRFIRQKRAAFQIVLYFKSIVLGRSQRAGYQSARTGIIAIQSLHRGIQCRHAYSKLRLRIDFIKARAEYWQQVKIRSAILVQGLWRSYSYRSCYKKLRKGIVALESRWRAKRAHQLYLQFRRGLITIQTSAKESFHLKSKNCTLIQQLWRRNFARLRYVRMVHYTIRLQRRFRSRPLHFIYRRLHASLVSLQSKARFFHIKKVQAAIVLQTNWRMTFTKSRYTYLLATINTIEQHRCSLAAQRAQTLAAIRIQEQWKCYRERLLATKRLQDLWRSFQKRREEEQRRQEAAVICIQSWHRSVNLRFKLLIKVICATILQSVYRGHRQRMIIQKAGKSATVIQHAWILKSIQLQRKRELEAVIQLQAFWRAYVVRKTFRKVCNGVFCLQFLVRRRVQSKLYCALLVQKTWRMHRSEPKLKVVRSRVIKLQSHWRRMSQQRIYTKRHSLIVGLKRIVKEKLLLQNKCALRIQRAWRMKQDQCNFQHMRWAALCLQTKWRCLWCRSQFTILRHGCILFQRIVKQRLALQAEAAVMQSQCAIMVQKTWRMHRSKPKLEMIQRCVIILQSHWRQKLQLKMYMKRHSLIVGMKRIVKEKLLLHNKCALKLQQVWRMKREKCHFQQMRLAALCLQTKWRHHWCLAQFTILRHGLVLFQRLVKERLTSKAKAAVILQRRARMASCRSAFLRQQSCVVRLQNLHRRALHRQKFDKIRTGFILLQRMARDLHAKKLASIIFLQSEWRMKQARARYVKKRSSAIVLQKQWRRDLCRSRYAKACIQIALIQKVVKKSVSLSIFARREAAAMRIQGEVRERNAVKRAALMIIQRHWRMFHDQWSFRQSRSCILIIQASFRRHNAQSRYRIAQLRIIKIQSLWRQKKCLACYALQLNGFVSLQQKVRQVFVEKTQAVTVIQSAYRKHYCQKLFTNIILKSTKKIQTQWRRKKCMIQYGLQQRGFASLQHKARQVYVERVSSAVVIQAVLRMLHKKLLYKSSRTSAICIQSQWRMRVASIQIQKTWRAFVGTSSYQALRRGFTSFQRVVKARFKLKIRSVTILQRSVRRALLRTKVLRVLSGFLCLQSVWRRRLCRKDYAKLRKGVFIFQGFVRQRWEVRHMSAVIIQARFLSYLARMNYMQLRYHAAVIQARHRGYMARKSYKRTLSCCVAIQSRQRRFLSCVKFECMRSAAVAIQSRMRSFMARMKYKRMRSYAIVTQTRFRPFVLIAKQNLFLSRSYIPSSVGDLSKVGRYALATQMPSHFESQRWMPHQRLQPERCHQVSCQRQSDQLIFLKSRVPALWRRSILNTKLQQGKTLGGRGTLEIVSIPFHRQPSVQSYGREAFRQVQVHWEQCVFEFSQVSHLPRRVILTLQASCRRFVEWAIVKLQTDRDCTMHYTLCGALFALWTNQAAGSCLKWTSTAIIVIKATTTSRNSKTAALFGFASIMCAVWKLREIPWQQLRSISVFTLGEKQVLYIALLLFALTSAMLDSSMLCASFVGLSISVLIQRPSDHVQKEAATKIQSCWRLCKMRSLFLQRKKACEQIQGLIRRYQERKRVAALKIQQSFRRSLLRRRKESTGTVSRINPTTRLLVLKGQISMAFRLFLLCWAVTLLVTLFEARHAYHVARLAFFVIELIGLKLVKNQICMVRNESRERQRRSISTLQNAFRRRQALRKWKENIGVHDHEKQFCDKLQNFEQLLDKLKSEVLDEIVEVAETDPTTTLIEDPMQSFRRVYVEYLSEEKAATRIQAWWRCISVRMQAARLIQSWSRGIYQRRHFLELRHSAITIQTFLWNNLFSEKREKIIKDTLKELLCRRHQIISVTILQRWFRMVTAKARLAEETRAASSVARWWRGWQERRRDEDSVIVAQAVRTFCKYRTPASHALAEEDEILQVSSSRGSDDESYETSDKVTFYISEADSFHGENQLLFPMMCANDSFVRVTETDSGMELAVEAVADFLQEKCCGFEVFLPK